ncbi:MAG: hypothetical protein V6Z78_00710 [Holosporaceae bacterium]
MFVYFFCCAAAISSADHGSLVSVEKENDPSVTVCACVPRKHAVEWNGVCEKSRLLKSNIKRFLRQVNPSKARKDALAQDSALETIRLFAAQQQAARDTIEGLCTYFAEDAKQTGDIKDWKALLAHNKKAMDLLEDASTKKLKIEHGSDHQCTQWDSFLQKSIEKYGEQLYFAFCLTHYTNALHAHLVELMKANPMGEGYDFAEYQKMKAYTEEVCLFKNNQQFKQFSFDVIQAMNGQNLSEKMLNCFLNNIDPARCAITKRYTFTNTPLTKETIQDAIESIAKKYKILDDLQSLYKEFLKFSQAQPYKIFFGRYAAAQKNKQLKLNNARRSLDGAQNFAQGWRALAQVLAQEDESSIFVGLYITKEHIFFKKRGNPPRNLACEKDPFTFLAQLIKDGYGEVIKQYAQKNGGPFRMFVFSGTIDEESMQTLSAFLKAQSIAHKIGYTDSSFQTKDL